MFDIGGCGCTTAAYTCTGYGSLNECGLASQESLVLSWTGAGAGSINIQFGVYSGFFYIGGSQFYAGFICNAGYYLLTVLDVTTGGACVWSGGTGALTDLNCSPFHVTALIGNGTGTGASLLVCTALAGFGVTAFYVDI